MTEIKIDRNTLPEDGQKIKWQTQKNFDEGKWQEGTFCDGDDLFCVGFENSSSEWDAAERVLHWEVIK